MKREINTRFKKSDLNSRTIGIVFYYIHTEKYSPKSYVVNFRTQISSSQSEERTRKPKPTKNST